MNKQAKYEEIHKNLHKINKKQSFLAVLLVIRLVVSFQSLVDPLNISSNFYSQVLNLNQILTHFYQKPWEQRLYLLDCSICWPQLGAKFPKNSHQRSKNLNYYLFNKFRDFFELFTPFPPFFLGSRLFENVVGDLKKIQNG